MILLTPKLIPLITAFRRMIKMLTNQSSVDAGGEVDNSDDSNIADTNAGAIDERQLMPLIKAFRQMIKLLTTPIL